ncbi:MAG: DNA primase catalytic subunit PriS [Thermoplasmata archaeon]|nr:MAG: DNA primase catalytic subunit PriS [Thermoplasmata archaeon]
MKVTKPEILIKTIYRKYYEQFKPEKVEGLKAREWAYIPFSEDSETMVRHIGVKNYAELKNLLMEKVPKNVYYSSAYYINPGASKMEEKGWIGADLVFDIDADHIPWAKGKKYDEMLEIAKKEMIHLIENFIISDFGFDEGSLKITFSGGRGYHLRITDYEIRRLSANARKEIADYLYGSDIDVKILISHIESGIYTNFGWPKKIHDFLAKAYMEYPNTESWILKKFRERGTEISEDEVKAIAAYAEYIHSPRISKRGIRSVSSSDKVKAIEALVRYFHVEIDKVVTGDSKRLIRYPSSLHGKTGFFVKKLRSVDVLEEFNPLEDAVVLPSKEVKVLIKSLDTGSPVINAINGIRIKDYEVKITEGVHSMPLYAMVFIHGLTRAISSVMIWA